MAMALPAMLPPVLTIQLVVQMVVVVFGRVVPFAMIPSVGVPIAKISMELEMLMLQRVMVPAVLAGRFAMLPRMPMTVPIVVVVIPAVDVRPSVREANHDVIGESDRAPDPHVLCGHWTRQDCEGGDTHQRTNQGSLHHCLLSGSGDPARSPPEEKCSVRAKT